MNLIERIQRIEYPEIEQTVGARDAMLYGLALGFGSDPCDPGHLKFVYERELQVFPTMAITLCYPGMRGHLLTSHGLDMREVLHVFQGLELFAPIPIDRALVGRQAITGVFDKGESRGVLWTYENHVRERDSGAPVCVLKGASMSRVGGGTGSARGESPHKREVPTTSPDAACDIPSLPQAALIYRLSGDYNPLHADPETARQGGFRQPILHGRCTFGIAGRAIVQAMCSQDGSQLRSMEARFSAPVYPGETIRTEMWRQGGDVQFRCKVLDRDLVVLDQGYAQLRDAHSERNV